MKQKQQYDAVLQNWVFSDFNNTLHGAIFGDERGRFDDGELVATTPINKSVSTFGQLREGNVVQTRNTRYLLGKQQGLTFPDGHKVEDTSDVQLESLRRYMRNVEGYVLVYTDNAVFFRRESSLKHHQQCVSFADAVRLHNSGGTSSKLVKVVKLQKAGNRIVTQCHKVKYL